jgi:hypothetical protein
LGLGGKVRVKDALQIVLRDIYGLRKDNEKISFPVGEDDGRSISTLAVRVGLQGAGWVPVTSFPLP